VPVPFARLLALRAPDADIDTQPGVLRCPRCFAKDIVPSMPRNVLDRALMKLGLIPRHCRACGKRFHVPASRLKGAAE
jgi:predicted Zn-ribbon and HTH transcriptional regulator